MTERNFTVIVNSDLADSGRDPRALLSDAAHITRLLELVTLGVLADTDADGAAPVDDDLRMLRELAWAVGLFLDALKRQHVDRAFAEAGAAPPHAAGLHVVPPNS